MTTAALPPLADVVRENREFLTAKAVPGAFTDDSPLDSEMTFYPYRTALNVVNHALIEQPAVWAHMGGRLERVPIPDVGVGVAVRDGSAPPYLVYHAVGGLVYQPNPANRRSRQAAVRNAALVVALCAGTVAAFAALGFVRTAAFFGALYALVLAALVVPAVRVRVGILNPEERDMVPVSGEAQRAHVAERVHALLTDAAEQGIAVCAGGPHG